MAAFLGATDSSGADWRDSATPEQVAAVRKS